MKRLSNVLFTGLLVASLSGCSSFIYQVQVMNYGSQGVIVYDKYLGQGYQPLKLNTIAPNGGRMTLPYFKGHPEDLPTGKHEITWQLADLRDCAYEQSVTSTDPQYPGVYIARSQCTFVPIPGKLYKKVIDFDEVRRSWAYIKTGWLTGSLARNTLWLAFVFKGENLELEVGNGTTNPWR
ncbi:MAG: hypothetical protein H7A01_03565 [Hahellaceae bacterium]|nr:hypothetical protein [Hahellaceae bacterium]MCP5212276.1 hypothetical protein [Hahellaceae bacterium]